MDTIEDAETIHLDFGRGASVRNPLLDLKVRIIALMKQLRKDAASEKERIRGDIFEQLEQIETLVYQLIPDDHAAVDPISTPENDTEEKAIVALQSLILKGGKVTERGAGLLAEQVVANIIKANNTPEDCP